VEAGDPAKQDQATPVIDRAAAAFARWTDLIAQRLIADGVSPQRAEELAMLTTSATEGAIVVARASRDVKPLDLVHGQLRALMQAETSERKTRDD
jgi:vacuolar-type H+-ATPase subunit B/Vma2